MIEATNPCGEQPLLPNEACNLGLGQRGEVRAARASGGVGDRLGRAGARGAARGALPRRRDRGEPVSRCPQIDATVKANRRIGLGVMGWADLLFTLGIPYDSQRGPRARRPAHGLHQGEGATTSRRKLAEERGPFPNWSRSIYRHGRPLRNSTVTTIAPTGTISMIAGCSSGIEPVFALAFEHRVKGPDGERVLPFVNETFERVARERGFYSDALMAGDRPARRRSTASRACRRTRARLQDRARDRLSNGTSATRPRSSAPRTTACRRPSTCRTARPTDDVARAYLLAWELGCLGITVFRDGCKGAPGADTSGVAATKAGAPRRRRRPSRRQAAPAEPRRARRTGWRRRSARPTSRSTRTRDGEPFEVFV